MEDKDEQTHALDNVNTIADNSLHDSAKCSAGPYLLNAESIW